MALADTEVQHQAGVTGEPLLFRQPPQFLHQPGFSDPGFPSDVNRLPVAGFAAGRENTGKLAGFTAPADECQALMFGGPAAQSVQAPYPNRPGEPLDRDLVHRFANRESGNRALYGIGNTGLARPSDVLQARSQSLNFR